MRKKLAYAQVLLPPIIWFIAFWGALNKWEPFVSDLYHFAWWSYIFFLDGLLFIIAGESWLLSHPRVFFRLLAWSVTFWLVFEAYNLVLKNWRYVGMIDPVADRWAGYTLAFATVLPGVLLTSRLLIALGAWKSLRGSPLALGFWRPRFLFLGTILAALPLLFPSYAFPLIWIAFIFLLDPICHLLGGKSVIEDWAKGRRQEHLCLFTAGLICGIWWELWNYPASAKWVYSLPVLNFWKIFEMPILGYLGFIPFAIECAVFYNLTKVLEARFIQSRSRARLLYLVHGFWWVLMFSAIDTWTRVFSA